LYSEELEKPGWQEELQAQRLQQRDASYSTPEAFAEAREHWMRVLTQVLVLQISGDVEQNNFGDCTIRYDDKTIEAVSDTLARLSDPTGRDAGVCWAHEARAATYQRRESRCGFPSVLGAGDRSAWPKTIGRRDGETSPIRGADNAIK
jgi:hypothetical protein